MNKEIQYKEVVWVVVSSNSIVGIFKTEEVADLYIRGLNLTASTDALNKTSFWVGEIEEVK